MRVEYSDIEEGSLILASPESIYCNVKPSPISCVGSGMGQGFTCGWLQIGFNLDIMTYILQSAGVQLHHVFHCYGSWGNHLLGRREHAAQ